MEGESKKSLRSSGVSYSRPLPSDMLLCLISPLQQNFSKGQRTLFFFEYCFGFLKLFTIAFPFWTSILNLKYVYVFSLKPNVYTTRITVFLFNISVFQNYLHTELSRVLLWFILKYRWIYFSFYGKIIISSFKYW